MKLALEKLLDGCSGVLEVLGDSLSSDPFAGQKLVNELYLIILTKMQQKSQMCSNFRGF